MNNPRPVKGRGAAFNPPNRFEPLRVGTPPDLAGFFEIPEPGRTVPTRFYVDHSRTVLAKNDSPDLGFTYSINPYRGCEHGCVYCYARPSHEYLGFSAGLDFETRIMVKLDIATRLAEELSQPSWTPQTVVFSGNTDCYQPAERTLQLTRRCLEVFLNYRNPVSLITKNALVQRDMDLLGEMAHRNLIVVIISITTLQQDLVKTMEPRTSAPAKRLETIEALARHGIPVGVNVAPIIPGLTDSEIPAILEEAAARGARYAGYTIVRLSHAVKEIFLEWLRRELPYKAGKVIGRLRDVRGGKLSESEFGKRMSGEGAFAAMISRLFKTTCQSLGLNETPLNLATDQFLRTPPSQISLDL